MVVGIYFPELDVRGTGTVWLAPFVPVEEGEMTGRFDLKGFTHSPATQSEVTSLKSVLKDFLETHTFSPS